MSFDEILVAKSTKVNLESFLKTPSHGLLLVGEQGAGKKFIAGHLANQLLAGQTQTPIKLTRPDGKNTILIEQVRELLQQLVLVPPGKDNVRRVVIIEDAHFLNRESQNMLLKTLEEPPQATVFILTCSFSKLLLPTIISRLEQVKVLPVSLGQAKEYFGSRFLQEEITSFWHLSGGNPALLIALLDSGQEHPLKSAIEQAKVILSKTTYQRLAQVDDISKSGQSGYMILALQKILAASQASANSKASGGLIKKRKLLLRLGEAQAQGANTKLLLTNLMSDL